MIVIPTEQMLKIELLAGSIKALSKTPWPCWDLRSLAFLVALGKALMKPALGAKLSDVVTLAYWLRAANLKQLQQQDLNSRVRLGLGLIVHFCSANVPVNFAFSLAFALLAGNSSVLRLSSKRSASSDLIIDVINELLTRTEFEDMRSRLVLLRYGHNDVITANLLAQCDGRILWGGDATISHLRQFSTPSRSREVAFADRYSLALLVPNPVLALNDAGMELLANRLFNDILVMDQAACSSPQMFVWLSDDANKVEMAQARVWSALAHICQEKQALSPIGQMNKFVNACDLVLAHHEIHSVRHEADATTGLLTRLQLHTLPLVPDQLRGYFGTLIEVQLPSLAPLVNIITERYQTLCYFGLQPDDLRHWIFKQGLRGIDRIVPVGQAIDMSLMWDGYDLLSSLSRGIEIR